MNGLLLLASAPHHVHGATTYQDAVLAHNPLLYWTFDEAGDSDNAQSLVNTAPENALTPQGGASRAASTVTLGGASLTVS